jgi:4-amino-4-deoxychorismate lyase
MKVLSLEESQAQLSALNPKRKYWVMYSSLYGGLVKDPEAMVIPLDDHMVHRGDGIFEAFRFKNKKIFDLDGHLNRLLRSADLISLKLPFTKDEIAAICQAVCDHSPESVGMLRLFVSRGFGDFSPNPYSTTGSQLFVVSTPFAQTPAEKYEKGVSVGFSKVAVKPGIFAQVKSCNYLPNVLTKKEAVDQGWDFAININDNGFVAEGPTENILVLTERAELIAPKFDYTLRGTTLLKVLEIAEKLKVQLKLSKIVNADLSTNDLAKAKEIMMVGTTLGVLPVTKVSGQAVGRGDVGPVAQILNQELNKLF